MSQVISSVIHLIRRPAGRVIGEREHAARTQRAEVPGGRDRQRCEHRSDRDRRSQGNEAEATSEARKRLGSVEGTSRQRNSRAASGDRAGCCQREVGMMAKVDGATTAVAVANTFLDIQDADQGVFRRIDHMKLQKLVYYAHAWWLANQDEPLYGDDVEAWPWGPVVRNVYLEFKHWGRGQVDGRGTELVKVGVGALDFRIKAPEPVSDNVRAFLGQVWETHKGLSGVQLSNATHAPGEPWDIVRNQYGSLDGKPRIPNELIRDVFRAKRNATSAAA